MKLGDVQPLELVLYTYIHTSPTLSKLREEDIGSSCMITCTVYLLAFVRVQVLEIIFLLLFYFFICPWSHYLECMWLQRIKTKSFFNPRFFS